MSRSARRVFEGSWFWVSAFVGGFARSKTEEAFGAGADGLLDEIACIDRGGGDEGDLFEMFHGSRGVRWMEVKDHGPAACFGTRQ